jgi:hypothetical protein
METVGPPAIADPRQPAAERRPTQEHLDALLLESQDQPSRSAADALRLSVTAELRVLLESGSSEALQGLIEGAGSPGLARSLWLRLAEAWTQVTTPAHGDSLAVTLFAMPVVIVAGLERSDGGTAAMPRLPTVLPDVERIGALGRQHGILAGCENFALANALAADDAVAPAALPKLLEWQQQGMVVRGARDVHPAPIELRSGQPTVSTRYLIGTALSGAGNALLDARDARGWGLPLAGELARQLAQPGATVLALPRPPEIPPLAWMHGRLAAREVAAQLFASDALRRFRAQSGEPVAVISAHRCPDATGGGELRLSLSTLLDTLAAEGFRCPLLPVETAADAVSMLGSLLEDCRVADVRVLPGIHPDRDPATGDRLLFRADALPAAPPLH